MNFSPRIEEAKEEQLYNWIQSTQPGYGSLASDELTRRRLDKLTATIVESDGQSAKLEASNYRLQIIMMILTAVTTAVALFPALKFLLSQLSVLLTQVSSVPQPTVFVLNVISLVGAVLGALTAFLSIDKFSRNKKFIRKLLP